MGQGTLPAHTRRSFIAPELEGMKMIYLDHAATTPVDQEVLSAMLPLFRRDFGNPSSSHGMGWLAKEALEEARVKVAQGIGATANEVYFTSGGTEANNLALIGVSFANRHRGNHIVTTAIEHHSILDTCFFLKKWGFHVTYIPVDSYGVVEPADVRNAITDRTILVSVMHANNEVGTIEPVAEIGKIAREQGVFFHTDAVQTFGHIPVRVDEFHPDLLSASAHKLYGPKGVGMLFVRRGVGIEPRLYGGQQEGGYRPGTENLPAIVGFGKAVEIAGRRLNGDSVRLAALRDHLMDGLTERVTHIHFNGHQIRRIPNNLNITIDGVDGDEILLELRLEGICVSRGSACMSSSDDPSHVLLALGLPSEAALRSLRLTLGRETTEDEVERVLAVLPAIIARVRRRK
jgi:cysteine desulfurase